MALVARQHLKSNVLNFDDTKCWARSDLNMWIIEVPIIEIQNFSFLALKIKKPVEMDKFEPKFEVVF